jgi:predicted DNA-binding transcriptional regulator AlpA
MAELISMLGVTRRRVGTLVNEAGFPPPIANLSVGRLWAYSDVMQWAERTGRTVHPLPEQ